VTFVRRPLDIEYPYTHSTGPVVGRALAALRDGVLLGARCLQCGAVGVPARDWCERCGGAVADLVPVGPGGVVRHVARVHRPTALAPTVEAWALIRLDGADTDLLYAVRGDVQPGGRVRPVWREQRAGSITDIEAFEPGEPEDVSAETSSAPIEIFHRHVSLPFTLSAGTQLSRYYTDIREGRGLHGVRCSRCDMVLVPPREACPRCWADTEDWIPIPARGIVTSFVVVNVPFHGQQIEIPYVLAWVRLDGADTSFLHLLSEIDPSDARMGMRVEAVWREQRSGFPNDDIDHFRPTGEPDAPLSDFIEGL